MAETPSYNHADIQRYLQHKMSSQEMHEFEKALMNDPFLADALEGFSKSDDSLSRTHLQQIETAITGEQQKAKVVPLATQKAPWWKVAAVILLVVSAGAITYSVLNNKSLNKKNDQIAASSPDAVSNKEDTIRAAEKTLTRADVFKEPQISVRRKTGSPIIRHNKPATTTAINNTQVEVAKRSEEKKEIKGSLANSFAIASAQQAKDSYAKAFLAPLTPGDSSNEKMLSKSAEPVRDANTMMAARAKLISSDTNENFTSKATNNLPNAPTATQAPPIRSKMNKDDSSDSKIDTNDGNLSLAEVVVTTKRNMKESVGTTIRVDSSYSATPVEGWMNYQQYLHQQSAVIQDSDKNNSNKEIEIEFFVNAHGKPTNVKVLTKMDKRRAEKITSIIENGPIWETGQNDKKVKVIIQLH